MKVGLILATMLAVLVAFASAQCTWSDTAGNNYNFAGLTAATDYVVTASGQSYSINVCQAVKSCDKNNAGVCQTDTHQAQWSAGSVPGVFSQGSIAVGQGAILTYTGGDSCLGTTRSSVIALNCDPTQTGSVTWVSEQPSCTYNFVSRRCLCFCCWFLFAEPRSFFWLCSK
jgi:hypothetical protein